MSHIILRAAAAHTNDDGAPYRGRAVMTTDHTVETVILQPVPAELLALLETAFPRDWQRHLHNFLGDADPADLSPDKLSRFTEHVFWLVKHTGLKDPAAWIVCHRARLEAAAKEDRGPINKALTFDGLLFATLFDMNSYIRTLVKDRTQWPKNYPGRCQRIEDALREIASRPPAKSKVDLGAEPAGPSDQTSPGAEHQDDHLAMGGSLAGDLSPPHVPISPPPLATATCEKGTTKSEAVPVDPAMSEATPPVDKIVPRAQLEAAASASAKLGSPAEIGDIATHQKSAERDPVALKNSPATTPALPPRVAYGATKAEVLSRAKAGIEAGEPRRLTAERLACANEDFNASQKEIGQATGLSRSTVSRLLTWRRSGYKLSSPHGATTRAGRASQRKHRNGSGGGGGAK
jgi:hypothetical protein